MKRYFKYFSVILAIFFISIVLSKVRLKKDEKYLLDLNLHLTGKVIKTRELNQGHNFGVVFLDVISSNLTYYDGEKQRERHIGFIDGNLARIAVSGISFFRKGDTLIFNVDKYIIRRDNKIVHEGFYDIPWNFISPYNEINDIIN